MFQFLDTIPEITNNQKPWKTKLPIGNRPYVQYRLVANCSRRMNEELEEEHSTQRVIKKEALKKGFNELPSQVECY